MARASTITDLAKFPPNAVYEILKPMTVDGVNLTPGDTLSDDSPLRQMPRRLSVLSDQRRLRVVAQVVTTPTPLPKPAARPVEPEPKPKVVIGLDLSIASLIELQAECARLGVPSRGNRIQIRSRLRALLD